MHEIYAIRYATFAERMRQENFIVNDMHDGPMPLDYFVWLIKRGEQNILVDTGFNEPAGKRRNRHLTIPVDMALVKMGVALTSITDVIVTHLHYDHAGNLDKFPTARFHLQEREMAYATGRCMCHKFLRHPFDVEPITEMVRHLYANRVIFHKKESAMAPGIKLRWVGGHPDGLQIVQVNTARGPVVLASDAAHYYDNMRMKNPFPLVFNVEDMVNGWQTVADLAGDESCIIPGHDPAITRLFRRSPLADLDVYALHEPPIPQKWKEFAQGTKGRSDCA